VITREKYLQAVARAAQLAVEYEIARAADAALGEMRSSWNHTRGEYEHARQAIESSPISRASRSLRVAYRTSLRENDRHLAEIDARLGVIQATRNQAAGNVDAAYRRMDAANKLLETLAAELYEAEDAADKEEQRELSAAKGEK
jgi:hypothetical protein